MSALTPLGRKVAKAFSNSSSLVTLQMRMFWPSVRATSNTFRLSKPLPGLSGLNNKPIVPAVELILV